jgi:hypothetical protein
MNRVLVITSVVTAVAVLIYTIFAGLQWWAIRKQGEYASQQVGKIQGQLDVIQEQARIMSESLAETRNLVSQNERAVKAAERIADLASAGERAYVGVTGLVINDLSVGKSPILEVTFSNAGKTPAFHFFCVPLLAFGEREAVGKQFWLSGREGH